MIGTGLDDAKSGLPRGFPARPGGSGRAGATRMSLEPRDHAGGAVSDESRDETSSIALRSGWHWL